MEVIRFFKMRSDSVCLNSFSAILSGIAAESHAASLAVGSFTRCPIRHGGQDTHIHAPHQRQLPRLGMQHFPLYASCSAT